MIFTAFKISLCLWEYTQVEQLTWQKPTRTTRISYFTVLGDSEMKKHKKIKIKKPQRNKAQVHHAQKAAEDTRSKETVYKVLTKKISA